MIVCFWNSKGYIVVYLNCLCICFENAHLPRKPWLLFWTTIFRLFPEKHFLSREKKRWQKNSNVECLFLFLSLALMVLISSTNIVCSPTDFCYCKYWPPLFLHSFLPFITSRKITTHFLYIQLDTIVVRVKIYSCFCNNWAKKRMCDWWKKPKK
jgi:hypothetical protein